MTRTLVVQSHDAEFHIPNTQSVVMVYHGHDTSIVEGCFDVLPTFPYVVVAENSDRGESGFGEHCSGFFNGNRSAPRHALNHIVTDQNEHFHLFRLNSFDDPPECLFSKMKCPHMQITQNRESKALIGFESLDGMNKMPSTEFPRFDE